MPKISLDAMNRDFRQPGSLGRLVLAGLMPLAACGAQLLLWPILQPLVWLLFYPAVFFSSWIGGRRGGLLATMLSTVLVWYCFIPPRFSFAVANPVTWVSIGIFVVMGILFSHFHEQLRQSNKLAADAQFRALFEQALVGMTQVGLDGRFQHVNHRLCDILGYTREELLAKTFQEITHPDDLKPDVALLRRMLAGEIRSCTLEKRYLRKDQSTVTANLTVALVREDSGKPTYFISVVEDITERKQAEVATAQLAAIVQFSDDAIIGKTLDGIITSWNAGAEKIFGYAADEMVGHSITQLAPPDRQAEESMIRARLQRGESVHHFETVRVRKDARLIDVSVTVSPIRSASGEIIGASKVARDITERKRAEQELHESEERFRNLYDNAVVGFYRTTPEGRIVMANPALLKLLGFSSLGELMQRNLNQEGFAPGSSRAAFKERLERDGQITGWEAAWKRRDGSTLFVSENCRITRDPSGQHQFYDGSIEDISERKLAEEALRENRAKLEAALASMTDAVFISDDAGKFIEFNDAFATFHRFKDKAECATTLAEYPGFLEVFLPNGEPAPLEMWAVPRALRGETVTNAEYTLRRKDTGETWAGSYSFSPIRSKAGVIVGSVVVGRDITERKQAEEQIKRSVADLKRSNQELEHFAYIASHDLQEPLRMISSYTQLLEQHFAGRLDDKAAKYIHYAVDGAIRMQTLINDLLTYSRAGRRVKPLEPADSHAVLGMAIRNLATTIAETHAVITSDELPTLLADASQLALVFQNLLANAIKFRRAELPRIHVSARQRGGEWLFSVQDNGIGIAAQYAERVFVIFQRLHTREEYPGTGIGLSVCKRIVERHGGKIWFESQPGSGTTFFFTIPTLQSKPPTEPSLAL